MKHSPEIVEKAKVHIVVEIIEYLPNAVVQKNILKKTTGNVTASSFAAGSELEETISPHDCFVQIIEGEAEIFINKMPFVLRPGQGITITAHTTRRFKANTPFKMISTSIKPAYED